MANTIKFTIANAVSEQKDFAHPFNLFKGFLKRSTIRYQLDDNSNPVVDTIEGDVLHLPIDKGHNLAETNINFDSIEYDFNTIQTNPSWLTTFFARQKFINGILVGYDRVCIYSSQILSSCLAKTLRYIGLISVLYTFDFTHLENTINAFTFL